MRMQVDQARHDEPPNGRQHALGARRRNRGFHRLDDAVADADIAHGIEVLARVEHAPALDHEVELVVGPHRRADGGGNGSERRADSGGAQEGAARERAVHGGLPLSERPS
jgi:hypothetical protein